MSKLYHWDKLVLFCSSRQRPLDISGLSSSIGFISTCEISLWPDVTLTNENEEVLWIKNKLIPWLFPGLFQFSFLGVRLSDYRHLLSFHGYVDDESFESS